VIMQNRMYCFHEKRSGCVSIWYHMYVFAKRNLHIVRSSTRNFSFQHRRGMLNMSITREKRCVCASIWFHRYILAKRNLYIIMSMPKDAWISWYVICRSSSIISCITSTLATVATTDVNEFRDERPSRNSSLRKERPRWNSANQL